MALEVESIRSRLIPLFGTAAALREDVALLFKAVDRRQKCLLAQSRAVVEDGAVPLSDAGEHLGEADVVAIAAEPQRSPDDVHEDLEFGTGEAGEEVVEDDVRHLCAVGDRESFKWVAGRSVRHSLVSD